MRSLRLGSEGKGFWPEHLPGALEEGGLGWPSKMGSREMTPHGSLSVSPIPEGPKREVLREGSALSPQETMV